jgi:hypothetical protein
MEMTPRTKTALQHRAVGAPVGMERWMEGPQMPVHHLEAEGAGLTTSTVLVERVLLEGLF